MQLTGFTDLSLRMLMRLAVLDAGETTTTGVLAEQLHVSYAHATKAVTALGALGAIEARRGRYGGLRLAEEAGSISIGSIVRDLEGVREIVECEGSSPCPLRHGCGLRSALKTAQEAFLAALDPLTVADVSGGATRALLLDLGPRPRD